MCFSYLFIFGLILRDNYCQRFAASRSGDEPRPSLHKYKQNFKLITFPISNKSRATPFLETAVGGCAFINLVIRLVHPFLSFCPSAFE